MSEPEDRGDRRTRAIITAALVVFGALWPSRARPDVWRERRGIVRHFVTMTAFRFAAIDFGCRARGRLTEKAWRRLRERLGREPTAEELEAELQRAAYD